MAQAIKSVLLLDFDSLFRSLARNGAGVADQFSARAGVWLEGMESGEIVGPGDDPERRRFQLKRCYADPKILAKNRGWLTANGVQIVECAQLAGISKSSSATHLILDALDSMEPEPEEVILLVADLDLTPVLFRLKARRQRVVIYATAETPQSYRALADDVIEESALLRTLSRQPEPATPARGAIPRPPRMAAPEPKRVAPPVAPPASVRRTEALSSAAAPARRPAVDRDALAALVRRIHQATSVPLFSPKAFADLFRLLVEEVKANGYKFQSTSENVANGMNALGRNVTKRQVGFVIKGLALRGHVFTEEDGPDQLAESFYEQVLFLSENAKVLLTEPEKGLVLAWVVGLRREEPAPAPPPVERRAAPTPIPMPPPAPRAAARPTAAATARPIAAAPAIRRREPDPAPAARPVVTPPPLPAEPAAAPARVVRAQPPTRPVRAAESAVRPAPTAARPQPQPAIEDIIPEPPAPAPVTERPRPSARTNFAQRTTQNAAGASMPERRPRPEPPPESRREAEFEDSILSAIADAVDVLADDSDQERVAPPVAPPRPAARGAVPTRTAPPVVLPAEPMSAASDADEIGDEIQRILATYSQNR